MKIAETIVRELIFAQAETSEALAIIKRKIAKQYKSPLPNNITLLKTYHELVEKKSIKPSVKTEVVLRTRPVRSLSGIVNISVLTKPYRCPGKCLYCPSEKGIPKSYVSGEPAVERAKALDFNPFRQVKKRIEMLEDEGHPTDKIELRIVGGTWSFYLHKYQDWFVKKCFDACNARNATSLKAAQKKNETAQHRIIGLSIETRPDFINPKEILRLRKLGVTMVELGVQSICEDVLKKNRRGHGVKEIISATRLLKNAGFKVLYQMMPNLFGSSPAKDLKMFKVLFSDQNFQPDLLKIYPCALLKNSDLFGFWKKSAYRPYSEKQLINLIRAIKKTVPYYTRIQRIARDIPSKCIVAGPARISNIRQIVAGDCRCIRCREVKAGYDPAEELIMFRQDYPASGGLEIFLSYENKNRTKLFSLLRLRILPANMTLIREIHTYGQLQPINQAADIGASPQHKGLGRKLIAAAEKISQEEFGAKKIAVISGVGVREYYSKLGYRLEKTYMVKKLD